MTMNPEVLRFPKSPAPEVSATTQTRISAIHLEPSPNGAKLGLITQIPAGVRLGVCGDGYNDRTVKVCWEDQFYFVFRADISPTN